MQLGTINKDEITKINDEGVNTCLESTLDLNVTPPMGGLPLLRQGEHLSPT